MPFFFILLFSGVRGAGPVPHPEEEQGPLHRLDQGPGGRQQQTGKNWEINRSEIKISSWIIFTTKIYLRCLSVTKYVE